MGDTGLEPVTPSWISKGSRSARFLGVEPRLRHWSCATSRTLADSGACRRSDRVAGSRRRS